MSYIKLKKLLREYLKVNAEELAFVLASKEARLRINSQISELLKPGSKIRINLEKGNSYTIFHGERYGIGIRPIKDARMIPKELERKRFESWLTNLETRRGTLK